ncbi:MAG: chromate transporter [Eubacteriales bacterium]|nr:chromate transporter [Eubacteriales bacterium]
MLWKIFKTFFRVGLFTIGGGYAMLPVLQEELTKRCWLTDEECLDAISLVNGLPGPLVVNGAAFMGYKMKGVSGAFAAVTGAILPSIGVILIVASVFSSVTEHPWVQAFFTGARPAVCALLVYSMVRMGRSAQLKRWYNAILAVAALLAVRFLGVPHGIAILSAAVIGVLVCRFRPGEQEEEEDVHGPSL